MQIACAGQAGWRTQDAVPLGLADSTRESPSQGPTSPIPITSAQSWCLRPPAAGATPLRSHSGLAVTCVPSPRSSLRAPFPTTMLSPSPQQARNPLPCLEGCRGHRRSGQPPGRLVGGERWAQPDRRDGLLWSELGFVPLSLLLNVLTTGMTTTTDVSSGAGHPSP